MRVLQCGWEAGHLGVMDTISDPDADTEVAIETTQVRGSWSARSLKLWVGSNKDASASWNLSSALTEVYVRFGLRPSWLTNESAFNGLLRFVAPGGVQCSIGGTIPSPGQLFLKAWRGTEQQTALGTASVAMTTDRWYLVEVHVKIDDTTGLIQVKIDGETVLDLTNIDTKNQTDTGFNSLTLINRIQDLTEMTWYIDDFAMNDTSGTINNSWVGDGRISALVPNGAGSSTQWTRGGADSGANWSQVEEVPPNDDTDYVTSNTIDNKDLYALTAADADVIGVNAVQVWARARREQPGTGDLKLVVRSGATEQDSAIQALSDSWAYERAVFETDPSDGGAWTKADLDSLEAGVKVA